MEHLPRKVPSGDMDILGMFLDAFLGPVGGAIGDAFDAFGGLLDMTPPTGGGSDPLGNILGGIAGFLNGTNHTATVAQTTATAAQSTATAANSAASTAVSTAQEAANAAADAQETADIAYALSSYWEAEAVIASAAVQLGVNELRIGMCQNVPAGQSRKITDLHIALLSQPAGLVLESKKWNAAGTASSVIHTATLGANVTRVSYNNLEIPVADKERVFWNVASVTGSAPPNALQCALFGVIL